MDALLVMGTELFNEFTNIIGSLAPAIDEMVGGNVLGTLISHMGLPGFAGLILMGCVFGD